MAEKESEAGPSGAAGRDLGADLARIAEQSQRLLSDFLTRQAALRPEFGHADPLNIGRAFLEFTTQLMANPAKLAEAHISLWRQYVDLWQHTARRLMGEPGEPVIEPTREDRRFRDKEWSENLAFDYLKQSYLLSSRWLLDTVGQIDGLDAKERRKIEFYTRQFLDALSPTNFTLTNPEVLRATRESGGENLLRGLKNMLDDLEAGGGKLAIKMVDPKAFRVGENLALAPGKVVFRNDLIELLQYEPATAEVYRRPLLIIPPWINKYYILDLRPENSFIRWAVERGYTVFVVSWVNPDERLAAKSFEDYMREGPLAALDAVSEATGETEATAIGYCLGGTLLAATLAYMAAKHDGRVRAATFFVSLVDFAEAGDLTVFIDEAQVKALEKRMSEKGYLDKEAMHTTFNMLRANDLIWSFVVNNYLLGKEPFPLDLLYWNGDSTRMPMAMHSFYLRKMYLENKLREPGGIELGGVPIDLGRITIPTFILSTKEDHIAPWKATFAATSLFKGPARFVLAASGHVAGVINPPAARKYGYWTGPIEGEDPDRWLNSAVKHEGSWWTDWDDWNAAQSGEKVPARKPGGGKLVPLADAPGTYVLSR